MKLILQVFQILLLSTNGEIPVNKKVAEPSEPGDEPAPVPSTNPLGIISKGAIRYDVNKDGIDDVVIDSQDIRNLADKIVSINKKWTENFKDDDKGLLDNVSKTKQQMEEYKKTVAEYEKNVK